MTKQVVLILEDDPTWQKILQELITDLDFKPVVTASYEAAIAELPKRLYALAVVDISLVWNDHADRGGVAVLKEISQLTRRLPTIVVTGYPTVELAIETLADLAAVHFFQKNEFNRRKFKEVVRANALSETPLNSLSERERQVLSLMAEGQTNQEIADRLTVSINTIKKHVQSIFTKLNVSTRAAAVAKAAEQEPE
ncbi:MAG TPA: response regulator transcription factor [Anaerolineae bacterium]|mgnify:CR=1 FL=1|nr:response regulator transcription factor [Anaerolineae bacterium]MCB0224306.1 response regulator transcription factor [Anaerolineae bacterium]HRV93336.1 response regulator transcription factor [Anaerolineae bacterium]